MSAKRLAASQDLKAKSRYGNCRPLQTGFSALQDLLRIPDFTVKVLDVVGLENGPRPRTLGSFVCRRKNFPFSLWTELLQHTCFIGGF